MSSGFEKRFDLGWLSLTSKSLNRTLFGLGILLLSNPHGNGDGHVGSREPLKTAKPSEGPLWGVGDTRTGYQTKSFLPFSEFQYSIIEEYKTLAIESSSASGSPVLFLRLFFINIIVYHSHFQMEK